MLTERLYDSELLSMTFLEFPVVPIQAARCPISCENFFSAGSSIPTIALNRGWYLCMIELWSIFEAFGSLPATAKELQRLWALKSEGTGVVTNKSGGDDASSAESVVNR